MSPISHCAREPNGLLDAPSPPLEGSAGEGRLILLLGVHGEADGSHQKPFTFQ
jgi:hypothetical protein